MTRQAASQGAAFLRRSPRCARTSAAPRRSVAQTPSATLYKNDKISFFLLEIESCLML